jgi:4-alpha-glucanotransferase
VTPRIPERRRPTPRARRVAAADAWGITDGFVDALGRWRPTSPETRRALLAAMGADPDLPGPAPAPVQVVRAGSRAPLGPGELRLEAGGSVRLGGSLPDEVPPGYHRLLGEAGERLLIVAPARCPRPPGRIWGWAAQLYAVRSSRSWGIGDLADLGRLGRWSAALGARVLLVNPLPAVVPGLPQQPSPYYPSSRRFRNPLYLSIEDVPGARDARLDLEPLARAGRELNGARRIDRDAVYRLKMDALERLWRRFAGDPAFDAYRDRQGAALEEFATFCALAERHGAGWTKWPAAYRRPDGPRVREFRHAAGDRVAFHAWLQWLLDRQLARAAAACPIMQDLPIGVDPEGADAWAWQDLLARGVSVGAPPDRYVAAGQNWGLPPFVPHRLRAAGYVPFIETLRATLAHAGGLRIDHVMGLFRLFWIPPGATPADGGYVRYPAEDLLAITALESQRAGAVVVGEDLGTVEEGVREAMAAHGLLSYRCVWFESDPPSRFPTLSLGAIATHDLPTIAGLWDGSDVEAQRKAGLAPNEAGLAEIRQRLARMTRVRPDGPVATVIERAHARLAAARSLVVTATLEDALAVRERPNMPGTRDEWPNWSLALPVPLEEIARHPLVARVAGRLAARRPSPAAAPAPPPPGDRPGAR